jgi:hypothetical protein
MRTAEKVDNEQVVGEHPVLDMAAVENHDATSRI